MKRLYIKKD